MLVNNELVKYWVQVLDLITYNVAEKRPCWYLSVVDLNLIRGYFCCDMIWLMLIAIEFVDLPWDKSGDIEIRVK